MFTAGIVAEFNPFHLGHSYLIEQARRRGASHIAVCMSGAAVQRGETAVFSKHDRAKAAIENGADLVVELSAPYSCSAARFFADAAVQILGQLNIDALAFGSESRDEQLLVRAARAVESLEESEDIRAAASRGESYPAAVCQAAAAGFGEDVASIISSPNSTLAVEYIRALWRQGIDAGLLPVKRIGAAHDSDGGEIASGMSIRRILTDGGDITGLVPRGALPERIYDPSAAEDIMLYRLITAERGRLTELPEVNGALADRIIKCAQNPSDTLAEFMGAVKSRNVTLARIRRSALHLAIGVTRADFFPPPYIRVLAFNRRGAEILSRAKGGVPVSVSLRELEQSSPRAARIAAIENAAVRLMQLGAKGGARFENEYTRRVRISE